MKIIMTDVLGTPAKVGQNCLCIMSFPNRLMEGKITKITAHRVFITLNDEFKREYEFKFNQFVIVIKEFKK